MPLPTATVNSHGGMFDLFTAMKTTWDAQPELAYLSGPYANRKAPGIDKTQPYVIVEQLSDAERTGRSTTTEYWLHRIEFTVYDYQNELALQHVQLVGQILDKALNSMTLESGTIAGVSRSGMGAGDDDLNMKEATVSYEITRTKPRQDK